MKKLLLICVLCLSALGLRAQTASDSVGIYAINGNMVAPIEALSYKSLKISPGFMSAKAKLEFRGKTSPHHFNGTAKFRVYFGSPGPYEMAKLYMFTPTYSIDEFGVGRFDVKKDSRYLTTTKVSIFGGSTGVSEADKIDFNVSKVRPGVYEVTVTGAPGEYCIMHMYKGSAGYSSVFDFTID